jgi:sugar phosphate isomerase/epimerase
MVQEFRAVTNRAIALGEALQNNRCYMLRREFLAAISAAPLLAAKNHIGKSRFSFITDEAAATPADAIAFAHKYGLQYVELREVPGAKMHYCRLPEAELKAAAKEFHDNGLKVSFFNTPYLKITLPGTEPVRRRVETPEAREKRIARDQAEYDQRIDNLKQGIRAAQILGVTQMRVFTFLRVAEPAKVEQRVAEILGEMAHVAAKENVKLLVENEGSCNVATSPELASMVKLLPEKHVGLNWDPHNALGAPFKELAYPDGYQVLPKKRIGNLQTKGKSLLETSDKVDWASIFHALERDGYQGQVGLETHYFDGTKIEKSHLSMQEMLRIAETS